MVKSLHYIDLFAGCGGISLGLCKAGLSGLFAVEQNVDAFATFRHNLIDVVSPLNWPEWLALKNWNINDLLEAHYTQLLSLQGHVDLVVGGPPCQGFSVAGRRQATDQRNSLIDSYLKFVEIVRPHIIVFENVRGFTLKFTDKSSHSDIIVKKLNDLGYSDARGEMVNFAEYGVPQRRERFLVIASRQGLSDDVFSTVEGNRTDFLDKKGIGPTVNSRSALSDLEQKHGVVDCPDSPRFLSGVTAAKHTVFQRTLRLHNETSYVPQSHRFVNHTPAMQEIFERLLEKAPRNQTIKGKERETYGFKKRSLMVLDPNEPAATITTIPDDFVHYAEPRVMTVRECARLQTFPDWFEFKGPYTTGSKERVRQVPRYTQVGNAVPPLFAEQLGIAITQVLS